MSKEENQKIDYKQRHQFWQEKALEQFGVANNFFTTISIGILGYLINENHNSIKWTFKLSEIKCYETLLGLTIIIIFISVVFGCLTLLSRLYDLRLTRLTIDVRKKDYNKKFFLKDKNLEDYCNICCCNCAHGFCILLSLFFTDKYKLDEFDLSSENSLIKKFTKLRCTTNKLGKFSWQSFKMQILFLLIGILLYTTIIFF